tara:strand:+ start:1628 stop:1810 length:183 start_codon:yes stop_codon:yes gene_type:complete
MTPSQVPQCTPAGELRRLDARRWLHSGISGTVWRARAGSLVSLSEPGEAEEEEEPDEVDE